MRRREWNRRFADELQRLVKCPRKTALAAARGCSNWNEMDPEEAAECEAEYWREDSD